MTDALAKIREAIRGEADGTTFPMPVEDARALIAEHERLTAPPTDEWDYAAGYQADNGIEMRWFAMSGGFTIREAAENEVERYSDSQIRLIRRPKPGPWEVVPDGE